MPTATIHVLFGTFDPTTYAVPPAQLSKKSQPVDLTILTNRPHHDKYTLRTTGSGMLGAGCISTAVFAASNSNKTTGERIAKLPVIITIMVDAFQFPPLYKLDIIYMEYRSDIPRIKYRHTVTTDNNQNPVSSELIEIGEPHGVCFKSAGSEKYSCDTYPGI